MARFCCTRFPARQLRRFAGRRGRLGRHGGSSLVAYDGTGDADACVLLIQGKETVGRGDEGKRSSW